MTAHDEVPPAQHVQLAPTLPGAARIEVPRTGGEREVLSGFLDWHRETFALKCSGVPADRMSERTAPPSGLSLHGLLRHLAGVERWWFRQHFAGEDLPMLNYSDDAPDQDFEWLDGHVAEAFTVWREECAHSRRIVAAAPSLDATCRSLVTGREMSLRYILVDLIAEYARHNGHADLLRERTDGATGH